MGRQALNKETIKKQVVEKMRKLGTYKPQFDDVIDIFADMLEQYRRLEIEFAKKGFNYASKTNSGDLKKSPLVSTMEHLRKDILNYSDRLALNPKSFFKDEDPPKPQNKLAEAIKAMNEKFS